jgi:hypothetical protein
MPEVRWPNFASFPEDGFSQQENLATPHERLSYTLIRDSHQDVRINLVLNFERCALITPFKRALLIFRLKYLHIS